MAKASRRRLKVFQAQFGFYDSVVAAPSQTAALAAWGTHQNLFAEGHAGLAEDATAVAAALAHPGAPLRRAAGSMNAFSLDPDGPEIPATPRPEGGARVRSAKRQAQVSAPPPDRSPLDAAEARLAAVNARRVEEEADLDRKREALEADDERSRRAWARARREAERAVAKARAAYRKAGG